MTICRNGARAALAGMAALAGVAVACMPAGYTSETPVIFVMHGNSRTGQSYFDVWEEHAISRGFLLVVPEFNEAGYPGSRSYNLGNIFPGEAPTTRNPASAWTYTAIEHLFDAVRAAAGSTRTAFRIYGHSAGSQFVHRFLMTRPDAPVERAVAANAGWYTLPSDTARWPYGLGDSGFDVSGFAVRFQLAATPSTEPPGRRLNPSGSPLPGRSTRFRARVTATG